MMVFGISPFYTLGGMKQDFIFPFWESNPSLKVILKNATKTLSAKKRKL